MTSAFKLMLTSVLVFLISLSLCAAPSTEWSQTFDGDEFTNIVDVVQTADGGYTLFGSARDEAEISQLRLIKLDSSGSIDWIYTSAEDQDTVAMTGLVTRDGGYYIAGDRAQSDSTVTSVLIQKVSPRGEFTWANGYGVGEGWNLQRTLLFERFENSFFIFNTAVGEGGNSLHTIIARPGGTSIGNVDCPTLGSAVGTDIIGFENASFLLSAGTATTDGQENAGWLIMLQQAYRFGWMQQVEGSGAGGACTIARTTDGQVAVCGLAVPAETNSRDIYLAKFDMAGEQLWYRTYGGSQGDFANEMVATEDGGVVIVGMTMEHGGNQGILVFKVGSGGEVLWAKVLGDPYDVGVSIHQTSDGGFIIGANCGPEGIGCEGVRIIKLSPDLE